MAPDFIRLIPVVRVPSILGQPWVDGLAFGLVIFLRRDVTSPGAILAHERAHIRQQWRHWLVMFALRYYLCRRARAKYEAEAYAESVRNGASLQACAEIMSRHYNLRMSPAECADLIRIYLEKP
jgi:hypothetical protein